MNLLKKILIGLAIITVITTALIYIVKNNFNPDKYIFNLKQGIYTLSSAAKIVDAQENINFSMVNKPCSQKPSENVLSYQKKGISFCAIFNEALKGYIYYGKLISENKATLKYNIEETKTINKSLKYYNIYQLENGIILGVPDAKNTTKCSLDFNSLKSLPKECIGFIDVNGVNPPNKEVTCKDGITNSLTQNVDEENIPKCIPYLNKKNLTDIYPVAFHDNVAEPATTAARQIYITDRKNMLE